MNIIVALASILSLTMAPTARAFVGPSPVPSVKPLVRSISRPRRPAPFGTPPIDDINLLLCRAVNDETASVGDGSEVESTEVDNNVIQPRFWNTRSIKERLLKASNVASLLCALDCTILPAITIILPLFGVVAASPAQMEFLHELGHQVALFFVLPVGGLATTLNYSNHRKLWIGSMGWTGLLLVLAANAGCHLPGAVGHLLHVMHHGLLHRVTNLVGCACLLGSNFLSQRQGTCKDPQCNHKH